MARRERKGGAEENSAVPTGEALTEFAEDLGRFLGTVQSKATNWLDQRKAIADQLTQIRDTANGYLQQLTGASPGSAAGPRQARRAGGAKGGRKRKRNLSPEARERIAEAQRRRWAKARKAAGNS